MSTVVRTNHGKDVELLPWELEGVAPRKTVRKGFYSDDNIELNEAKAAKYDHVDDWAMLGNFLNAFGD